MRRLRGLTALPLLSPPSHATGQQMPPVQSFALPPPEARFSLGIDCASKGGDEAAIVVARREPDGSFTILEAHTGKAIRLPKGYSLTRA